ncbi:MAG TPA: hypothetical protein VNG12_25430 [Acidimicrobiales bacterium]|nr:hypothetical protein [Acidimicrobiales bacterium]
MPYGEPARTAAPRTRSTVLVVALACLGSMFAATTFAATPKLLTGKDSTYVSPARWPRRGQSAASPSEQQDPIAILAKVITAYLSLKSYPLSGAQDGITIVVTAAKAPAEAQDADDQSVVAVRAGDRRNEPRSAVRPARNLSSAYQKTHTCWQHHAVLSVGMTHSAPAQIAALLDRRSSLLWQLSSPRSSGPSRSGEKA